MEWAAIGAICAAITVVGLIGLWIWRLASKLAETDAKAKSAEILATGIGVKLSTVERDLANHKEHVAQEYVSRETLREVTYAINRIGDRLDKLFTHLMPKQ